MIVGYILAVITGISLGLLGGGGSILTVPVLVYALNIPPKQAIAMSLAIVGLTALVGSYSHWKSKNIDIKIALVFAPTAMLGTFLGAKLSVLISAQTQLLLFAVVMLIASIFMFKGRKETTSESTMPSKKLLIAIEGIFVGVLTGLVGVGGGFIIVPTLVLLGGVSMKKSIGTSLLIIAFNSLTGFSGYISIVDINWNFLLSFTLFTIIGILVGSKLVNYVPAQKLKKAFAVFLILMSVFIMYKNRSVFTSSAGLSEIHSRHLC